MNFRKSEKFISVGFRTKIRGGNKNISSSGLNALFIVRISGNKLNDPHNARKINNVISPLNVLLTRFFFFERLWILKTLISENGRESIRLDFNSFLSNLVFGCLTFFGCLISFAILITHPTNNFSNQFIQENC